MPFPRRLVVGLSVVVVLSGCMPLRSGQVAAADSVTPATIALAPTAPAPVATLDVSGFESRVVTAAGSVPTGTFVLVIKTGMITGDLTLKYNGAYDVRASATPRCRLDGTQNGQPLTLIVVGDKLYTKAGTGKYGVSSVTASASRLGLVSVRPDLPTLVTLIGGSVRRLVDVEPSTVGSVDVEHWRALVDADVFAPGATGTTTVDLWLDSNDLIRQVSYSLTSGGVASTTTSVTLTYSDFNSDVTIDEPAPDEVR